MVRFGADIPGVLVAIEAYKNCCVKMRFSSTE